MIRMSVPFSRRCVAKLWRRVCSVARLVRPAAFTAERQAACNTVGSISWTVIPRMQRKFHHDAVFVSFSMSPAGKVHVCPNTGKRPKANDWRFVDVDVGKKAV